MFKNYLKIGLRNLLKNKGHAALNIAGLAVGMTCFLLVMLYVRHELSYDQFHDNSQRIYRIGQEIQQNDATRQAAYTQVPLGPALENDFPETEQVIRFWRAFRPILLYGEDAYREKGFYFTDPDVFDVFSFDLLAGNPQTALSSPNSVVVTESTAKRLFGDKSALGQVIRYDGYPAGTRELTVTGVMGDLPDNSQFEFDYLASLVGVKTEAENWGSRKPIWTYVLLKEGTTPEQLERKLEGYIEKYYPNTSATFTLHLEPLTDIHLYSRFTGGFKPGSDILNIYLFAAIGFFILLIACINFMNLATAKSLKRTKEVGLRKVLGAVRQQLIWQFLGETILLSFLALLVSMFLLELVLPVFNAEFSTGLEVQYARDAGLLLMMLGTVLLVGLLAGSYPAVFLSRFRPVKTLRGRVTASKAGVRLRQGLVVFQFVTSIVLIVGTLLVQRQLEYIRSKKLGFNKDLLVVLPYSENELPLLTELSGYSKVTGVSVSQRVPVNDDNSDGRIVSLPGHEEPIRVESFIVDEDFVDTYQIEILAGRDFSKEMATDSAAFVINETAVKEFGWGSPQEALDKELTWSGTKTGRIIGVVKDFHTTSLYDKIEPVVLHMLPNERWWRTFISVRIRPGDLAGTLAFLESTWRSFTPHGVYDYFFIDDSLARLHQADQRFGRIFATFAGLAIVIACLGLFGLAAFSAEQRTKEVGIRKVLGASVAGLVRLLSQEFVKLVMIASLIAVPVAWFAMSRWLENFAYRVDMGWSAFVLSALLALAIALVTVSTQAVRAALTNPVASLRYE